MRFQCTLLIVILSYYVIGSTSFALNQLARINYTTAGNNVLDYTKKINNIKFTRTCGQIIDQLEHNQHGYIQSPNYPATYSSGIECTWILSSTNDTRIYITIFDIDIFTSSQQFPPENDQDSLYISLTGFWENSQRYSGDLSTLTPINLVTEGNQLLIRFKTARSIHSRQEHRGFRIAYQVRRKDEIQTVIVKPCRPNNKPLRTFSPIYNYTDNESTEDKPFRTFSRIYNTDSDSTEDDELEISTYICPNEPKELQMISRVNPIPYLVGLILDDNEFCAGSLISRKHVLTTAHCTSGVQKIKLTFGTNYLSLNDAGVQQRIENASAVYSHPHFSPITGFNDISIIRLSNPIKITRFVRQIHLPSWNSMNIGLVGLNTEISGWKETNEFVWNVAKKSEVFIEPNTACRTSLDNTLSGMMLCLKPEVKNCIANSGSPIATRCKRPPQQGGGSWEEEEVTFRSDLVLDDDDLNESEFQSIQVNPQPEFTSNVSSTVGLQDNNEQWLENVISNKEDLKLEYKEAGAVQGKYTFPGNGNDCNVNEYTENILLGLKSFGNCKNGFAFTRLTAHLDFINKIMLLN